MKSWSSDGTLLNNIDFRDKIMRSCNTKFSQCLYFTIKQKND